MEVYFTAFVHGKWRLNEDFPFKSFGAFGQGDYNMTPDRHLGSAWVDCCRPDLLITESTYATTIRDSKRCRERDFLDKVHKCVEAGGKVLIPVFALGRAQELCILLESYWDRMNLDIPIFFTTGMTQQATAYYKLFISWTNEKIKDTFVERNMFDFKHIKPLPQGVFESDGPMVVFATPGMLHAGQSLQIFKKWAPNKNNMVILPGYCVAGTIGYKILNGAKKLEFEKNTLDVRMKVEYLSFSAHADAKGIMQLINQCRPNNIMLVHGEAAKMEFLKSKIDQEFNIPCYMPANGELLTITKQLPLTVKAPVSFLRKKLRPDDAGLEGIPKPKIFRAAIVMDAEESHSNASPSTYHLMDRHEALSTLNESEHELQFTCNLTFKTDLPPNDVCTRLMKSVTQCLISLGCSPDLATLGPDGDSFTVIDNINVLLKDTFIHEEPLEKEFDGDSQHMDVVGEKSRIVKSRDVTMHVTYSYLDEYFGSKIYISLKEEVAKWAE